MRRIELLAPAGSYDAFLAAVNNGANAVYLGGSLFNARAFATNFTNEELEQALEYAHLREVKIYVTLNTLFYDEEIEKLMAYVDYLYTIGVDALIIQDMGLMYLVQTYYPNFEIHASTQVSVHNLEGVNALAHHGVSRVVLARENTLEEITKICQTTPLDIEVFVHGALCMSYSGQCLMSSLIGGRSGNRGKCAQPCRLAYKLGCDGKIVDHQPTYLLSAKDIGVLENISDYIDAGVTSFKIEGRMKRPEYVAAVVKAYRKAIDTYVEEGKPYFDTKDRDDIFQMFNRGISKGHAYHENNLITKHFPGNFGTEIGESDYYDTKQHLVHIKLTQPLRQGDGIRFGLEDKGRVINKMYVNGNLVKDAFAGQMIQIEFDQRINGKTKVYKTSSVEVLNRLKKEYESNKIKLPVKMFISGDFDQPLSLVLTYKDQKVEVISTSHVEKALQHALSTERIFEQLSKLGTSVYYLENMNFDLPEGMQFPVREINQMRREAIDLLNQKRLQTYKRASHLQEILWPNKSIHALNEIHVYVSNLKQCVEAMKHRIHTIYYPFELAKEVETLSKNSSIRFIASLPRIHDDALCIDHLTDDLNASDLGALWMFHQKVSVVDQWLNITNTFAMQHPLIKEKEVILSVEMSKSQMNGLHTNHKIGMIAYGRNETMITNYCPISQQKFNCVKKGCNLCKNGQYYLVDRKNEQFPMMLDKDCRMHLFNSKIHYIHQLERLSVDFIVLKFTFEFEEETGRVISDFENIVYEHQKSSNEANERYTLGYYKNKKRI